MTTAVRMIEDARGDLVDIEYYCSGYCYEQATGESAYGHFWPGGQETDSDVHCAHCKDLMWHGLECDCAPYWE